MSIVATQPTANTSSYWGSTAATAMAAIYDGITEWAKHTIPGGKLGLMTASLLMDAAWGGVAGGFSGNFWNSYFSAGISALAHSTNIATRPPRPGTRSLSLTSEGRGIAMHPSPLWGGTPARERRQGGVPRFVRTSSCPDRLARRDPGISCDRPEKKMAGSSPAMTS
jgi:hypothetical protein